MNIKYSFIAVASMLLTIPLQAHHSTSMFDNTRKMSVEATVKKLEWTSPHAWLQILVVNDKGEAEEWGLEMGTPAAMMREGWKPKSVVPGDKVTVVLNPLKNGEHGGNLVSVTKADGTQIGKVNP